MTPVRLLRSCFPRLRPLTLRLGSLFLLAGLAMPALAEVKVKVDGRIDPAEWAGAEHVTDFKLVEPLTGAPSPYPTEAWILSTPEGLAVAFRNTQPAGVPRTHERTRRDQEAPVDRVNLMVDFDGDGHSGYNFMVTLTDGIGDATITNQRSFSTDWDANWKHAASEDGDTWSVEMLIPWSVAPMRKARDGKRTIGIYLDRVIGSTGERVAWPYATTSRPHFLSDFNKLTLDSYSQSLLAVTPYATVAYDNITGQSTTDAGADIFWKPNGQVQLSATINPDFGQVESDDLVVNFSANETFFSDKRPFFTENQSLFEFGTPSDSSQLLYTRRIGGPADDGNGAGDITAAVKLNGNLGAYKYGVFLADEADAAGRSFGALRLVRDFDHQNIGLMLTQVDRPWLDRKATVLGVDHDWRPGSKWNISSRFIASDIDQAGNTRTGTGFTTLVDYEMARGWRQQWLAMHFGRGLQINDFGYLSRANLNYGYWQVSHRITDLPAQSAYSSRDWRWRVSAQDNDGGLALQRQFRMSLQSQRRDGGNEFAQMSVSAAGYDDRTLRGNGILRLPPGAYIYYERFRPRKGHWQLYGNAGIDRTGIGEQRRIGWSASFQPTYFFSDALSAFVSLSLDATPQQLIWQRDNLAGTFNSRSAEFDAGLNWTIDDKQEFRVKLQALGLNAPLRQAWRAAADGTPIPSNDPIPDFSVSTLGFQVRYRRELAPLSDLYIVYGRGGFVFNEFADGPGSLLADGFCLRDSEQILVKLSYRFEH
ncbi:hypothetical protein BH11PSE14_BH11PSE14_20330 [soil metagenome]